MRSWEELTAKDRMQNAFLPACGAVLFFFGGHHE
jgi:hypothetical protein